MRARRTIPIRWVCLREADGAKHLVALNPAGRSVAGRSAAAELPAPGVRAETVYGTDPGAKYAIRKGTATLRRKPVPAVILRME